jgi:hypothetical protein
MNHRKFDGFLKFALSYMNEKLFGLVFALDFPIKKILKFINFFVG